MHPGETHDTEAAGLVATAAEEDCDTKIARYRAALDAGGDPALVAPPRR
jgi:hypothetical protein